MVSEVESANSKKWEVGSAELKPTGLGFARASSALGPQSALKPACGTGAKPPSLAPRSLRNLKRKPLPQKAGANYIARYTCQISSANLAEIP